MKTPFALLLITAIFVAACDSNPPEPAPKPYSQSLPKPPSAAPKSPTQGATVAKQPAPVQPLPGTKGAAASKPPEAPKQGAKPRPNLEKTKQLFESISTKRPGAISGKVEWRDGIGIFLHPGTTPTEVVFDLSKFKGNANLFFWISRLPDQILAQPNAGTAAFTVELDGKKDGRKVEIKLPRKQVDRFTVATIPVNFTGATMMKITVDDSDGTQFCDWIFMGVE
jgi:hypothetical protein